MIMADEAVLVQKGNDAVWRFSAMITAPNHAPLGPIGHVEVDANTGQLLSDERAAQALIDYSQHFSVPSC
jgi:hypothetical protein